MLYIHHHRHLQEVWGASASLWMSIWGMIYWGFGENGFHIHVTGIANIVVSRTSLELCALCREYASSFHCICCGQYLLCDRRPDREASLYAQVQDTGGEECASESAAGCPVGRYRQIDRSSVSSPSIPTGQLGQVQEGPEAVFFEHHSGWADLQCGDLPPVGVEGL